MVTTRSTRNNSPLPIPASEASQESDPLELAIDIVQENVASSTYFKVSEKRRLLELLRLVRAGRNSPCASPSVPESGTSSSSLNEQTCVAQGTNLHGSNKSRYVSAGVQTSPEAFVQHPPLTLPDIPEWSIERLINQAALHRYENSLYGPIATLLFSLFPVARNFMIKPQGLFRKAAMAPESNDEGLLTELDPESAEEFTEYVRGSQEEETDPNITFDSYSGETGEIEFIPDLLVCKANAYIHDDKLLAIFEIKRKNCNRAAAFMKIKRYIKRGCRIIGVAAKIVAFLLIGDEVFVFEVDTSKDVSDDAELRFERTYPISSPQFLRDIHSIAVEHWNEPVVRAAPPEPSNPEDNEDVIPLYA